MLRLLSRIILPIIGIVLLAYIAVIESIDFSSRKECRRNNDLPNVSYVRPVEVFEYRIKSIIPIDPRSSGKEEVTVIDYRKYLDHLRSYQYVNLVKAIDTGTNSHIEGIGIILAAIIWKESSLGLNITNTNDGEHGSFGVAQILLDTAAKRLNVKTSAGLKSLKMKLLTDADFNLAMAIEEIKFWMNYHREMKDDSEKYWRHIIASYNAGWRSYGSEKGKKYADDVIIRVKALSVFFKDVDKRIDKAMNSEIERISTQYR